jgi:hypothetical protein
VFRRAAVDGADDDRSQRRSDVQAAVEFIDERVREFIAAMSAAGNPGVGRHDVGGRKHQGWILDYDPATGGSEIRVVIGADGYIYARRSPRAMRAYKATASDWLFGTASPIEPMYRALAFAYRLTEIRTFNGVPGQ